MEQDFNDEVEKTLRSLDGIGRAEPKPFLYTRLKARMDRQAGPSLVVRWQLRPAYLLASLVLLVGLNVWALVQYNRHQRSAARQPTIDNVIDDYGLSLSTDLQ